MQCEIQPFCNEILKEHWPEGVTRFSDIKEVDVGAIPESDVFVGGFPCQDVSLARMGPRSGLRGKQSGLFYKFADILGEARPRIVVLENVPGLLSSHGGRDFGIVVRTLADLGYGVGWRVLNSRYFGVPQSRQRVFIVGCYRDGRGPAEILLEPERGGRYAPPSRPDGEDAVSPFKKSVGDLVKGPIVQSIAYCLYACSARHTGTDWSRTYVSYPDGRVRRLTPNECEGVMGFPPGWTVPSKPSSDAETVDSLRYHALGNAVTVPVVQWIAERTRPVLARMKAAEADQRSQTQPYQAVRAEKVAVAS